MSLPHPSRIVVLFLLLMAGIFSGCGHRRDCKPCQYAVMPYYYGPAYKSHYIKTSANCTQPRYCDPYCRGY